MFPAFICPAVIPLSIFPLIGSNWSVCQKQKRGFEDCYQAKQIGPFQYYAVFDGHAGSMQLSEGHVAKYAAKYLHERLAEKMGEIDINDENKVITTIVDVFIEFDRELNTNHIWFGSTCTAVLIHLDRNIIYQANLGDSRSIIFDDTGIISSTLDHSPINPPELLRIKQAGGSVYMGRINGSIMVSRAFGDFEFKKNNDIEYDPINGMMTAVPYVTVTTINKKTKILLTSDAPFERNAYTNHDLIKLFNDKSIHTNLHDITSSMVQDIITRTTDDTTIIAVIVTPC